MNLKEVLQDPDRVKEFFTLQAQRMNIPENERDNYYNNWNTFSHIVRHVESDDDVTKKNPDSTAMGYYQFIKDAIPTAKTRMNNSKWRHLFQLEGLPNTSWSDYIGDNPTEWTREQSDMMFWANMFGQEGTDEYLMKIGQGDIAAMRDAYLMFHHTDPSHNATNERADLFFNPTFYNNAFETYGLQGDTEKTEKQIALIHGTTVEELRNADDRALARKREVKLEAQRLLASREHGPAILHGPIKELFESQAQSAYNPNFPSKQPFEIIEDMFQGDNAIIQEGQLNAFLDSPAFSGRPLTAKQIEIIQLINSEEDLDRKEDLWEEFEENVYIGTAEEEASFRKTELATKAGIHLAYVEAWNPDMVPAVREIMNLDPIGVPQAEDVIEYLDTQWAHNITGAANNLYFVNRRKGEVENFEDLAREMHERGAMNPSMFDPIPVNSDFKYEYYLDNDTVEALPFFNKLEAKTQDFLAQAAQQTTNVITGWTEKIGLHPYIYHKHIRDQNHAAYMAGDLLPFVVAAGKIGAAFEKLILINKAKTIAMSTGGARVAQIFDKTGKVKLGEFAQRIATVPKLTAMESAVAQTTAVSITVASMASSKTQNFGNVGQEFFEEGTLMYKLSDIVAREADDGNTEKAIKDAFSFLPFDITFRLTFALGKMGYMRYIDADYGRSIAHLTRYIEKNILPLMSESERAAFNAAPHKIARDIVRAHQAHQKLLLGAGKTNKNDPAFWFQGKAIPVDVSGRFGPVLANYGRGGMYRKFVPTTVDLNREVEKTMKFFNFPGQPLKDMRDLYDDFLHLAGKPEDFASGTYQALLNGAKMPLADIVKSLSLTQNEALFTGITEVLKKNPKATGQDALDNWKFPEVEIKYSQQGYNKNPLWKPVGPDLEQYDQIGAFQMPSGGPLKQISHTRMIQRDEPVTYEEHRALSNDEKEILEDALSLGKTNMPHGRNPGMFTLHWKNPEAFGQAPTRVDASHAGYPDDNILAHARFAETIDPEFGVLNYTLFEAQYDIKSEMIKKGMQFETSPYPFFKKEHNAVVVRFAQIAAMNDAEMISIATPFEQSLGTLNEPFSQIFYEPNGPLNQAISKLSKKLKQATGSDILPELPPIQPTKMAKRELETWKGLEEDLIQKLSKDTIETTWFVSGKLNTRLNKDIIDQTARPLVVSKNTPYEIIGKGHKEYEAAIYVDVQDLKYINPAKDKFTVSATIDLIKPGTLPDYIEEPAANTIVSGDGFVTLEKSDVLRSEDGTFEGFNPVVAERVGKKIIDNLRRDMQAKGFGNELSPKRRWKITPEAAEFLTTHQRTAFEFHNFPGFGPEQIKEIRNIFTKYKKALDRYMKAINSADNNKINAAKAEVDKIQQEMYMGQSADSLLSESAMANMTREELFDYMNRPEFDYILEYGNYETDELTEELLELPAMESANWLNNFFRGGGVTVPGKKYINEFHRMPEHELYEAYDEVSFFELSQPAKDLAAMGETFIDLINKHVSSGKGKGAFVNKVNKNPVFKSAWDPEKRQWSFSETELEEALYDIFSNNVINPAFKNSPLTVTKFFRPIAKIMGIPNYSRATTKQLWPKIVEKFDELWYESEYGHSIVIDKIMEVHKASVKYALGVNFRDNLDKDIFIRGRVRSSIYQLVDSANQAKMLSLDPNSTAKEIELAKKSYAMRRMSILSLTEGKVDVNELSNYKGKGAIEDFLTDRYMNVYKTDEEIKAILRDEVELDGLSLEVSDIKESLGKGGHGKLVGEDPDGNIVIKKELNEAEEEALAEAVIESSKKKVARTEEEVETHTELNKAHEDAEVVLQENQVKVDELRERVKELESYLASTMQKWRELSESKITGDISVEDVVKMNKELELALSRLSRARTELSQVTKDRDAIQKVFYSRREFDVAELEVALSESREEIARLTERMHRSKRSISKLKSQLYAANELVKRRIQKDGRITKVIDDELLDDVIAYKMSLEEEIGNTYSAIERINEKISALPQRELSAIREELKALTQTHDELVAEWEGIQAFQEEMPLFSTLGSDDLDELMSLRVSKQQLEEEIENLKKLLEETPEYELKNLNKKVASLLRTKERLENIIKKPDLTKEELMEEIERLQGRLDLEKKAVQELSGKKKARREEVIRSIDKKISRIKELSEVLDFAAGKVDPMLSAIKNLKYWLDQYALAKSETSPMTTVRAELERAFYRLQKLRVSGLDTTSAKVTRQKTIPSDMAPADELHRWSKRNGRKGYWRANSIFKFLAPENVKHGGFNIKSGSWHDLKNSKIFLEYMDNHKAFGNGSLIPGINQWSFYRGRGPALLLTDRLQKLVSSEQVVTLAIISGVIEKIIGLGIRGTQIPFLKYLMPGYSAIVRAMGSKELVIGMKKTIADFIPESVGTAFSKIPVIRNVIDKQLNVTLSMKDMADWLKFQDDMMKHGPLPAIEKAESRPLVNRLLSPGRRITTVADEGVDQIGQAELGQFESGQSDESFYHLGTNISMQNIDMLTEQILSMKEGWGQQVLLTYLGWRQLLLREGLGNVDHYLQMSGMHQAQIEAVANVFSPNWSVRTQGAVDPKRAYQVLVALREMENALIVGSLSGKKMREFLADKLLVNPNDDIIDAAMTARTNYLNHIKIPSLTQRVPDYAQGYVGMGDNALIGHLNPFARTQVNTMDLNIQRMGPMGYAYSKWAAGKTETPMGKFYAQGNALVGGALILFAGYGLYKLKDHFEIDEFGNINFVKEASPESLADKILELAQQSPDIWEDIIPEYNEVYGTDYDQHDVESIRDFLLNEKLLLKEDDVAKKVSYSTLRLSNIDFVLKLALYIQWLEQDYAPGMSAEEWRDLGGIEHGVNIFKMMFNSYGGEAVKQTLDHFKNLADADPNSLEELAVMIISDMLWHAKGAQESVSSLIGNLLPESEEGSVRKRLMLLSGAPGQGLPYIKDRELSGDNFLEKIIANSMFRGMFNADPRYRMDIDGEPFLRDEFSWSTVSKKSRHTAIQNVGRELKIQFEYRSEKEFPLINGLETKQFRNDKGESLYYEIFRRARKRQYQGNLMDGELKNYFKGTDFSNSRKAILEIEKQFKNLESDEQFFELNKELADHKENIKDKNILPIINKYLKVTVGDMLNDGSFDNYILDGKTATVRIRELGVGR